MSETNSNNFHGVGILLICLAPIIGAFFPLFFKQYKQTIHFFTAYASGLLLGFALIHLLPDAIEAVPPINSVNPDYPIATLLVGCTILLLLTISTFVPFISEWTVLQMKQSSIQFSSALIDIMGFWPGLAIHGIFEGLAFGVLTGEATDWVGIAILFLHKCVEFNALGTFLARLEISVMNYWLLNVICELPCLIGFIVAWRESESNSDSFGYFTSFSAGTFLYISLVNLLPVAMNESKDKGAECCIPSLPNREGTDVKLSSSVIEIDQSNEKFNEMLPINGDGNTGKPMLSEGFKFKLRGYIGVGLGFATFAALQLKDD